MGEGYAEAIEAPQMDDARYEGRDLHEGSTDLEGRGREIEMQDAAAMARRWDDNERRGGGAAAAAATKDPDQDKVLRRE